MSTPDDRTTDTTDTTRGPVATAFERLGADWAAVIVAAVLVLLAGLGLLPAIPFLIK